MFKHKYVVIQVVVQHNHHLFQLISLNPIRPQFVCMSNLETDLKRRRYAFVFVYTKRDHIHKLSGETTHVFAAAYVFLIAAYRQIALLSYPDLVL